jgi:hypothetical protein
MRSDTKDDDDDDDNTAPLSLHFTHKKDHFALFLKKMKQVQEFYAAFLYTFPFLYSSSLHFIFYS